MAFIQVLESEFKYLIEALEHGSSDPKIIKGLKDQLFLKTGYKWIG